MLMLKQDAAVQENRIVRVFVVDPQPLVASAIGHLIAAHPSLLTVGCASEADPLALMAASPDIILLAHEHGAPPLSETVLACKAAVSNAKICVIACHAHPELLHSVLHAGADGYTIKDSAADEVITAIKTIASGTMYVDPRVGAYLLKSGVRNRTKGGAKDLSLRETEIVRLIAGGLSNKQISSRLNLSEKTVKNHVSRIFTKLNISARTQAVMHAVRTGIA